MLVLGTNCAVMSYLPSCMGLGWTLTAWRLQLFYPVVLLYMVAAFLQGGPASSMGLLNNIRSFLFIRGGLY